MRYLLPVLIVPLPLVALFSGMAMTPLLAAVALLAILHARRLSLVEMQPFLLPFALFLLWPLATTLWSLTPGHSLHATLKIAGLCALGLMAATAIPAVPPASGKTVRYLTCSFLLCGMILLQEKLFGHGAIYALYEQLGQNYDRFMLKNVNRGLCALAVLIWPLMHVLPARRAWLVLGLLFAAVMVMHSLSAKLGLTAGIATYLALRHAPRLATHAVTLLPPLFLLAFPVLFLAAEPTLFAAESVRAHLPLSALQRLDIWHILLEYSARHELLGWGMDTTRAMPLTGAELATLGITEPPLHPHSPSLQILLEQGCVGLALSALGLYLLLRRWARTRQPDIAKALSGALIASYLVAGVSSFGIWQSWWIATLWIAYALWRWLTPKAA